MSKRRFLPSRCRLRNTTSGGAWGDRWGAPLPPIRKTSPFRLQPMAPAKDQQNGNHHCELPTASCSETTNKSHSASTKRRSVDPSLTRCFLASFFLPCGVPNAPIGLLPDLLRGKADLEYLSLFVPSILPSLLFPRLPYAASRALFFWRSSLLSEMAACLCWGIDSRQPHYQCRGAHHPFVSLFLSRVSLFSLFCV